MSKVTQIEFVRYVTYMANRATSWAGDCLVLPEDNDRPMEADALDRFTKSITDLLYRINEDRP